MGLRRICVPASDFGDYRPGTPVILGLVLGLLAGSLFATIRIGYANGQLTASTYNSLSGLLLVGSVLVGAGTAGLLGYVGSNLQTSVVVGVAPILGLSVGSLVTVALGFGRYDSSPYVLVAGLLVVGSVLSGATWVAGRAAVS